MTSLNCQCTIHNTQRMVWEESKIEMHVKFKRKIKRPKDVRLDGTHVSLHIAMSVDPSVL